MVASISSISASYPFEQTLPYAKIAIPWVRQYDFRFVEGEPRLGGTTKAAPASAFSKLWIGDRVPRTSTRCR